MGLSHGLRMTAVAGAASAPVEQVLANTLSGIGVPPDVPSTCEIVPVPHLRACRGHLALVRPQPGTENRSVKDVAATPWRRTVAGFVLANVVLLVYALFRPESLSFSIPFLMAPSLALMGVLASRDKEAGRSVVFSVLAIVVGLIAVILFNELTN